ncbi:MAG: hypothetical protein Q9160_005777 [Pyrenula sp. 1 TL-2023]
MDDDCVVMSSRTVKPSPQEQNNKRTIGALPSAEPREEPNDQSFAVAVEPPQYSHAVLVEPPQYSHTITNEPPQYSHAVTGEPHPKKRKTTASASTPKSLPPTESDPPSLPRLSAEVTSSITAMKNALEYSFLYKDRGTTKIALRSEIKNLKTELTTAKNQRAALERDLQSAQANDSSQLEAQLETLRATNAHLERTLSSERAAGLLAAHAAEDTARTQSIKQEESAEWHPRELREVYVAKRTEKLEERVGELEGEVERVRGECEGQTGKLESRNRELEGKIARIRGERDGAKRAADRRVEDVRGECEAEMKGLRGRVEQYEALRRTIMAATQQK